MNLAKTLVVGTVVCMTSQAYAGSGLGDWGHFLSYTPTACFRNPDGKPFTIIIHAMRWVVPAWNPGQITVRLIGPDGQIVLDGPQKLEKAAVTLEVKEAAKGVYRLHTEGASVWFESSLPQAVAYTGEPGHSLLARGDSVTDEQTGKSRPRAYYENRGPVIFQTVVPRRWWFWVPEDVTTFTAEAMRDGMAMSQREDWGFFIISPRGQRIRALWGQPPQRSHASGEYTQRQRVEVEVEPGAGGRFWCLEVSNGDSHQYSKVNISFEGIPPYLARSPEEWFDPRTGDAPTVTLYDDTPFIQGAPLADDISLQDLHHKAKDPKFAWTDRLRWIEQRWPHLEHFSPCPSLGDPDGSEILGDATFALWNPEGRDLGFRIGTYLTPHGDKGPAMAQVKVTGADGKTVLDKALPILHIHGTSGAPSDVLKTGKGVARVAVSGAQRWLSFTYPATPLVLIGQDAGEWKRFRLTACAPRNWYFLVPKGAKAFSFRYATDLETDVLQMEVSAPDRTMAIAYGRGGEQTVTVPEGLDGKIWSVRPSVGAATRLVTEAGPEYRHQDLPMTLEFKGVPGYLSPTWEQWFDPESPRLPAQRSGN